MRRIAFASLLVTLACLSLAVVERTAHAQLRITPPPSLEETSRIEYVHDVLVGTTQGRLNLRYNPKKSGPVTGLIRLGSAVAGDRLEGYRTLDPATRAESMALVQYQRNAQNVEVATKVYTADKSPAQRDWMGVSYALDVPLGGASAARNATAFRTNGPLGLFCRSDPACVARNNALRPLPVVQTPVSIDPAAGFGIDANGHRGPWVVRATTGGNSEGVLAGHVLGDALTGHYARNAGTLVFLRRQGGRLIQVFTGSLDAGAGGIKGGRGFPLSAGGGGAPFDWRVVTDDQIVSGLGSIYSNGQCLTPPYAAGQPSSVAGGALTMGSCLNNADTSWVVFATGTGNASTVYSLASVATGLCLHMPGTLGAAVVQQVCGGGQGQSISIFELRFDSNGVGSFNTVDTTAEFIASSGAMFLGTGGNCLSFIGGDPQEGSCYDGFVPEGKAAWTHVP
jgi:hypothetical protein